MVIAFLQNHLNRDRRKKRYEIPRSLLHKIILIRDRRKRRYEIPRSLFHKIILNRDRRKKYVTEDRDRFFTKRAKPRSLINFSPKKRSPHEKKEERSPFHKNIKPRLLKKNTLRKTAIAFFHTDRNSQF